MNRNTIQKILIGLFISACIFIGVRTFNVTGGVETNLTTKTEINTNSSSSRMTYGRFLEYLEMGFWNPWSNYNKRHEYVKILNIDVIGIGELHNPVQRAGLIWLTHTSNPCLLNCCPITLNIISFSQLNFFWERL